MQHRSITVASIVGLGLLLGVGGGVLVTAGPLAPPAGPVASTYKTLAEIEPRTAINATNTPGDANSIFRITQPGSYYLTGNMLGQVNKHGIEIAISNVTIDLNGFSLNTFAVGLDGISTDGVTRASIKVRNGTVFGWSGIGVRLQGANHVVEDVLATGNGGAGITVGTTARVHRCTSQSNGGVGIGCDSGVISECTASNNAGGILANFHSSIVSCVASYNSDFGLSASDGSSITQSVAAYNTGGGLLNSGIYVGPGTSVIGCTAHSNTSPGLTAIEGCIIDQCTIEDNQSDGIRVHFGCIVRNNNCSRNGEGANNGAGIHVFGGNNRLEANNCAFSARGVDVDAPGNIIIRNICSNNNTNWTLAANNVHGPIVDRITPSSPAVNGNTAPSALGTTDPNANFTY